MAMAGYNTFCEILSLDKRAILVPRTKPREEQLLRALRAAEFGLVRTLDPRGVHDPKRHGARHCAGSRDATASVFARRRRMLGGLDVITDLVAMHVGSAAPSQGEGCGDLTASSRDARTSASRPLHDLSRLATRPMPAVMIYVQHLLGIGHLMRARLIAEALADTGFDVHLVTGGMPIGGRMPRGVRIVQLPPIRVVRCELHAASRRRLRADRRRVPRLAARPAARDLRCRAARRP